MDKTEIAEAIIGTAGRMICYSKGQYNHDNPRNLTVFNANICTSEGKIWHGDLDITEDEENLSKLSIELDEKIYVLYEHDARFEHEKKPKLDKAVAIFSNGKIDLGKRAKNFIREEGKLLDKRTEQEEYVAPEKPEWEEDDKKYPESRFQELGTIPWSEIEALQVGPHYYENDELTDDERKLQNPLNYFFQWAMDELNKYQLAEGEKVDLFIRTQDEDRLTAVIKNFLINRMGMEEGSYRLKKEIGSLGLVMPNNFYDSKKGPKWTKDDTAYIERMGEHQGKPLELKDS